MLDNLGKKSAQASKLRFESLEPRWLLSAADSTVVFNELMYHPDDNQAGEWIELYNQMAVDMDLSDWSLDGGVQFEFAEGTVIAGGDYLVIAEDPAALEAATGLTDVSGPYLGKLSNGGERLVLRNNNDRLMDEVTYDDEPPWPMAADGSGASLAKTAELTASDPVENWQASIQAGGTPGAANVWQYEAPDSLVNLALGKTVIDGSSSYNNLPFDVPYGAGIDFTAGNVTDGSRSDVFGVNYWLGSDGDPTEYFTLDLGSSLSIEEIHLRNTHNSFHNDRGTGDFIIWASDEVDVNDQLINPVEILAGTLSNVAGLEPIPADVFTADNGLTPIQARYLKFETLSANNPGNAVGLNEIDVYGRTADPLLPVTVDKAWNYDASGADLGTSWREPDFDDAAWDSVRMFVPSVVITEAGTGTPDYFEVQNLSQNTIDTTGWIVVSNNAQNYNINEVHSPVWSFPGPMESGELLYRTDTNDDNIFWRGADDGWVMILDGEGQIMDFVVWGYSSEELASMEIDAGGFTNLRGDAAWSGPPVDSSTALSDYLQRIGESDHDNADDWTFDNPGSGGLVNEGLAEQFLGANIQLPSGPTTYYFRTEFEFQEAPSQTELTLSLLVDDGAVFYLNGVEVYRHNMPSGDVGYDTPAETEVGSALFIQGIKIPSYSLLGGTNVLAVEVHQIAPDDVDMGFGVELAATIWPPSWPGSSGNLALNEVGTDLGGEFFVELVNGGDMPVQLAGHVVRSSAGLEYVFPETLLSPGEFLALTPTQLGFAATVGEKLFLYRPNRQAILDGVEVDQRLRGRSPDGTGRWLVADIPTPGGPNAFALHDEIVINEIMYHHQPQLDPIYAENGEEWVELYNRGNGAVELGGWRLEDAVDFEFPAATILGPDEYLVIGNNATALQQKYPDITIIGNFGRDLSNKNDRVVLLDAAGNPADEVFYYDDKPWPRFADGRGGSLELRDPFADNSAAEAWAASDEAAQSAWKHYSYTMQAVTPVFDPAAGYSFHELRMGLLRDGEVLIDNVSVVEAGNRDLIQNAAFDTGTDKWRLMGNHGHSEVIDDPDNPGNSVLHLIATGPTSYLSNRVETTLKYGSSIVAVTPGLQYEISFDAKWLGGSNQLHTELYYNKVVDTTILEVPQYHGTPGARNSSYEANLGPTYTEFIHSPAVPQPGEEITVSVRAEDPQGVLTMTLWHRLDGGTWQSVTMTGDANAGYSATIPGQSSGAIVQFYVEGTDALGASSTYPAAGNESRALIKVDDGRAIDTKQNFRIILTAADSAVMHTPINILSNDRLGATIVYNESEVFYDAGVRLRGSMFSRQSTAWTGFNVKFPADHIFRGIHETVTIKRAGVNEIIVKHLINQAGDIPGMYDDIVNLISHRSDNVGTALLSMARYNDMFLESQFNDDAGGTMFKMEGIRVVMATDNGSPEGNKLPFNPIGWMYNYDISHLGNDPEQYRWSTLINSSRTRDDYSSYVAMAQAFSLSGVALEQAVAELMDVDGWMRVFAMASLAGIGDMYTQGNPHNLNMYARPEDGKIIALPWDWNFVFAYPTNTALWGNKNLAKIITRPVYSRLFYGHLYDIINTSFNAAYMTPWLQHYGEMAGASYAGYVNNIIGRTSFVLPRLPSQIPFVITTNGGNDFSVDESAVTLVGNGWIDVRQIRVDGLPEPLEVTWLDDKQWQVTVPVAYGDNLLNFKVYNHQDQLVGSDSITVGSTISERPLQDFLRITELNYNPHGPSPSEILAGFTNNDDFEFVELTNTGPFYLDLTGARFTDGIDFDFTAAGITSMAPGEYVVLARNPSGFVERYGSVPNLIGPYTGGLSNGGEHLLLLDPQNAVIHDFTYGDSGTAGWPDRADGNGATLQIIFTYDDYDNPANWRSSSEYLGSPGSEGSAPLAGVVVNEVLTHTPDSPLPPGEGQGEGPLVDAIELYNPTGAPVVLDGWWLSDSAGDFFKFQIPADTTIPALGYVTFYEGHYEGQTFTVDQTNEFGGTGEKDFALSGARGDDVWLLADFGGGSIQFADHVEFGGALAGEPFGRWPNGTGNLYPMTSRSLDEENSGPRLPQQVVISEVMYNPPGDDVPDHLEFLELYNFTTQAVDLTGWRLRKGFDYDFAPGTMLDAHEALVIVSFDPSDQIKLDAFLAAYGIGAEVLIVGNPSDTLSDFGERIQLQRPDTPPADDPLYVPHVIEDEVDYLNTWHASTDGGGDSLNRTARTDWGNEDSSWTAEPPTPGAAQLQEVVQVEGRYLFYNNSAYDKTSDAKAVASDKTALLPGGQATFANYTSYVHGINGIMIDITGLVDPDAIDENDFTLKIGNDDTPGDWTDAPTPSMDVTAGQIILTWPDGAIRNTWLEVTVLATENTGLDTADVFYFGNAVGETGDSLADAKVDVTDMLTTRQNPQPFFDPATIDNVHDFNRDRRVNAIDTLIARDNQTWSGTELELIDLAANSLKDPAAVVQSEVKNVGQARPLNDAPLNAALDWLYEVEVDAPSTKPGAKDDSPSDALRKLWSD